MSMEAFDTAISFSGTEPPEECREIGRRENHILGTVIYYKGMKSGTIYYISERGLEFARHMAALQKKTKK